MIAFPPPHPARWPTRSPVEAGLDPAGVAAAMAHAAEHETPWKRDLAEMVLSDFSERPPWNDAVDGPCSPASRCHKVVVSNRPHGGDRP